LRFEAGHHADDDFIFRDIPLPQLLTARSGLRKFVQRDRCAAEHPVALLDDACRLRTISGCIRNDNGLSGDLTGDAFQPYVEGSDESFLKIVESETVVRVKDDRYAG